MAKVSSIAHDKHNANATRIMTGKGELDRSNVQTFGQLLWGRHFWTTKNTTTQCNSTPCSHCSKQINAHKVRICAHREHQVQGRGDFEESFAHTVLGQSIKISVAISCFLAWRIFHFDIHNAFQTCPDDSPAAERTWLQINQTWLDYYQEQHPTKWPVIEALIQQGYCIEQFAVEMFMFVQG
jgi:hypothetical protein